MKDRVGEGCVFVNFGIVCDLFCEFKKVLVYYVVYFSIIIEMGDKFEEGWVVGNFSNVYY